MTGCDYFYVDGMNDIEEVESGNKYYRPMAPNSLTNIQKDKGEEITRKNT
jgi:hypothetical protein